MKCKCETLIWRRDLDENQYQRIAQCKKCKRFVVYSIPEEIDAEEQENGIK